MSDWDGYQNACSSSHRQTDRQADKFTWFLSNSDGKVECVKVSQHIPVLIRICDRNNKHYV